MVVGSQEFDRHAVIHEEISSHRVRVTGYEQAWLELATGSTTVVDVGTQSHQQRKGRYLQ
jgi:hypothetical protein